MKRKGAGIMGLGTVGRMGLLGTRMKCRGWVGEGTQARAGRR